VSRRRVVLASLAVAAALSAAACGGGNETGVGDGETVSAATWTGDLCTALDTWQSELTESAPDPASEPDIESTKDSLVSFLESAVAATQALVDDVRAAGVPEIENGEAIATEMQSEIAAVGDDFLAAKDTLEGLSTDDPAAFAAEVSEIGTTLTEAGAAAGAAFDRLAEQYPAAELDAAATDAPACETVLG
jgi:hypothetical protein